MRSSALRSSALRSLPRVGSSQSPSIAGPRHPIDRLPQQFPVGTRFVIEGRAGRISRRYVEFPDGERVHLPQRVHRSESAPAVATRRASQKATRKNIKKH